jgi:2-keto-4-pentenoate hydratase
MPDAVHASQRAALWHEKAASLFVAARRQGTQVERLPVELRPSTVDDGFAIQRKVSDVLPPIVWLANFLRERGLGLQAGQAVIAGSYAGVLELPLGEYSHIGFGALGTLLIRFFFSNRSA